MRAVAFLMLAGCAATAMTPRTTLSSVPVYAADARPTDRWGGTPLSDAETNGHDEAAALLRQHTDGAVGVVRRASRREAAAA